MGRPRGNKTNYGDVKLTATCHSCTSTPMTLCARTFCGNCVSSRLGRVSLRQEIKVALMSQIGPCAKKTLHSRACHLSRCMPKSYQVLCIWAVIDGSQKQIRESACQFCQVDSASACTRTLIRRVVTHELHVFFIGKTASFASARGHGVERPHVGRVHVTG